MTAWRELALVADAVLRHVIAILANLLPRRLWGEWEGKMPLSRMALPSAVITFLLGFAVGIPGFVRYAARAGSAITDAMIETAHEVNKGRAPAEAMPGSFAVSLFSMVAFAFLTPTGWLASYLVATGLYRCMASAVGDPRGDPLLAATDLGVGAAVGTMRRRRAAAERERLEGAEVPDVRLTGRDGGALEAAYVIVASRRKRGWEPGVIVITAEAWYRIGSSFERRTPGGLRTVYPLLEVAATEVLRRSVTYELPPLGDAYPVGPPPAPGD